MPCLCDHAAARLCHQDRNLAKAFFDSGNDCGGIAARRIHRITVIGRKTAADVKQLQVVPCFFRGVP